PASSSFPPEPPAASLPSPPSAAPPPSFPSFPSTCAQPLASARVQRRCECDDFLARREQILATGAFVVHEFQVGQQPKTRASPQGVHRDAETGECRHWCQKN